MKNSAFAISASFTRPANTTAYAAGDLAANSATAGSVIPLTFPGVAARAGDAFSIDRVRIVKSGTTLTNASFRLHLFSASPTSSAGDNAAFNSSEALAVATVANYLGTVAVTVGKSGTAAAVGLGIPTTGDRIIDASTTTVYGLLEALAAYTPASEEVFTVTLEGLRAA